MQFSVTLYFFPTRILCAPALLNTIGLVILRASSSIIVSSYSSLSGFPRNQCFKKLGEKKVYSGIFHVRPFSLNELT